MKLNVAREDVWAAGLEDRPGSLAEKLAALAEAGCELGFVIARRAPDKPGTGVVFLTPIAGAKQTKAAKAAGFHKTRSLHSVCVGGPDKAGRGARITGALAEKGINLHGLSAGVVGKRFVLHLAFDTNADALKAIRVLKAL